MPVNASFKKGLDLIKTDQTKVLGLSYSGKSLETAQYVPRAEAQSAPEISFAVSSPTATYMVVALDPDAPAPSLSVLGPILHWIQPGFKASPPASTLTSDAPFVVNYIPPGPPPLSSPHRYVFLLYEQPADFDATKYAPPNGKPTPAMSRMRYDLDAFIKKAGLGEPIAVNYFTSN